MPFDMRLPTVCLADSAPSSLPSPPCSCSHIARGVAAHHCAALLLMLKSAAAVAGEAAAWRLGGWEWGYSEEETAAL
jgi:hypothetical protein